MALFLTLRSNTFIRGKTRRKHSGCTVSMLLFVASDAPGCRCVIVFNQFYLRPDPVRILTRKTIPPTFRISFICEASITQTRRMEIFVVSTFDFLHRRETLAKLDHSTRLLHFERFHDNFEIMLGIQRPTFSPEC